MKYFASMIWLMLGRYCRKRGHYNNNTLSFFYRAYKLNENVSVLLAYLRFRRDLGYPLTRRFATQLLADFHKLSGRQRRQAANLLIESGFKSQLTSSVGIIILAPFVAQSPPIAALAVDEHLDITSSRVLSSLYHKRLTWRNDFAGYLRQRTDTACVVGNAGSIIGANNGKQIDSHGVVIRFNHYSSAFSNTEDIGKKVTVWSCAPNCTKLFADKDSTLDWSILSGPDVYYQMTEWRHVALFVNRGGKVLTVPLPVWRSLVRALHAPPSAGVLLLSWIIDMRGGAEGLAIAGFDLDTSSKQYHQALPKHKVVHRHNWEGEREILRQWKTQGLVVL